VEAVEDEGGKLWSAQLEAYIGGQWEGTDVLHGIHSPMWYPRLFDVRGNLIPRFREAAEADAEREKLNAIAQTKRAETAEAELARLRAELAALRTPPTTP
jgi:hypothetical protein